MPHGFRVEVSGIRLVLLASFLPAITHIDQFAIECRTVLRITDPNGAVHKNRLEHGANQRRLIIEQMIGL